MKAFFRVTPIVAMVVSLANCTSTAPLTLDTAAPGGRSVELAATGPIEGEIVSGHACFWVAIDGSGNVSLVWPVGSNARDNPLRVENSEGRVVAQVGDTPNGLGGYPSDARGCHEGGTQFVLDAVEVN